jgi:hypothetical protein
VEGTQQLIRRRAKVIAADAFFIIIIIIVIRIYLFSSGRKCRHWNWTEQFEERCVVAIVVIASSSINNTYFIIHDLHGTDEE